jgi:hypothetical protein
MTHKELALALLSLTPDAQYVIRGMDIEWHSTDIQQPSLEEIQAEIDRQKTLIYREQRAKMYPQIADQLDMLWHAIDSGNLDKSSLFYSAIKAIKDQYPKP